MKRNKGVYTLRLKKEIVYVGCSLNIAARVGQHYTDNKITFDQWTIIKESRGENMFNQETRMIQKHQPKYNVKKRKLIKSRLKSL